MRSKQTSAWYENAVQAWQLAILRYAVTLDSGDRSNVMMLATQIDRLGRAAIEPEFSFFRRTSTELCDAIAQPDEPSSEIFRRFLARIEDARLRRAFAAAIQSDRAAIIPAGRLRKTSANLWRGLSPRQRGKV